MHQPFVCPAPLGHGIPGTKLGCSLTVLMSIRIFLDRGGSRNYRIGDILVLVLTFYRVLQLTILREGGGVQVLGAVGSR